MQQVPRGTKRASRSTKFVYPQQVPRGRISSCYTCGQRRLQEACSGGTRPGRWRRGRGWRPSVVAESSHRKTLLQGRTLQNQIIQSLISRALTWGVTTLKNTWGLTLVDLLWSRENITCAWLGVGPLPGITGRTFTNRHQVGGREVG